MEKMNLINITDADAIEAAKIAKIHNPSIRKGGHGISGGFIELYDARRTLRIYFSGSNTRVLDNGIEVIEYCYEILTFLRNKNYFW